MFPMNGMPEVANGNAAAIDPESMLQQIRELAICVDEITTQAALNSLTTLIDAATSDDGADLARSATAAAEIAESTKILEAHIRRLLAAAAAI